MIARYRCPFCGLVVFTNDEERKISHEAPECERFAALMASGSSPNRHHVFVENLDPTTGQPLGRSQA